MDKPISVGDWVQVVRGPSCCNNPVRNGLLFRVHSFWDEPRSACGYCGTRRPPGVIALRNDDIGFFLYRLKRIPPLDELEAVRTEDEVTA